MYIYSTTNEHTKMDHNVVEGFIFIPEGDVAGTSRKNAQIPADWSTGLSCISFQMFYNIFPKRMYPKLSRWRIVLTK